MLSFQMNELAFLPRQSSICRRLYVNTSAGWFWSLGVWYSEKD